MILNPRNVANGFAGGMRNEQPGLWKYETLTIHRLETTCCAVSVIVGWSTGQLVFLLATVERGQSGSHKKVHVARNKWVRQSDAGQCWILASEIHSEHRPVSLASPFDSCRGPS